MESESLKPDSEEAALTNTRALAAAWDTVGWIYFKRGDLDRADAYLRAAFVLSQNAIVGDQLAQLLEWRGKKQEAAHYYLLAMAVPDRSDKNEIRKHYVKLTGKEPGSLILRAYGITGLLARRDWPRYTEKIMDAYDEQELKQLFAAADNEDRLAFQSQFGRTLAGSHVCRLAGRGFYE